MKVGTENRQKTMWAGALMVAAVIAVGTFLYNQLGGSDTPRPAPPPPSTGITRAINANNAQISDQTNAPGARSTGNDASKTGTMPTGNAPGPEAKKVVSSSGNLDPTLDQTAMLRTEHLVYSGSGRNIFSLVSAPSGPLIPIAVSIRSQGTDGPPPPPLHRHPTSSDVSAFVPADQSQVLWDGDAVEWLTAGVFVAGRGCFPGVAGRYRGAEVQDRVDRRYQHPGGRFDQQQYPDAAVAV